MNEIAIISDIHGNIWALDAVLADIQERNIPMTRVFCLGDFAWGPLSPAATMDRIIELKIRGIQGNTDRYLLNPSAEQEKSLEYRLCKGLMEKEHFAWLAELKHTLSILIRGVGQFRLCHGTPESDEMAMLETIEPDFVRLATQEEMVHRLAEVPEKVVACGHTHVPRSAWLPGGTLVVNPGSVGVPAYQAAKPFPHKMESGTPHAKYAILHQGAFGWGIEQISVTYNWNQVAKVAEKNGRPDWAQWLRTGRVS